MKNAFPIKKKVKWSWICISSSESKMVL